MKNLEDIKELKDACLILGLNPSDFIETSEVQKGVGEVFLSVTEILRFSDGYL